MKTKEPPCTERYARWCERSANQLMISLLLDFENKINEKIKIISTHNLTVLIMSVILRIEQKINGYLNIDKYPFVKEERV